MDEYQVKSKLYCPASKKDKAIYIIVNLAVVITAVSSVGSIFAKGFNLNNVTGCILAIAAASSFNARFSKEGHYEFSVLSLRFEGDLLKLTYSSPNNKKVEVHLNTVKSLEYSDQLECLRLVCDYKDWTDGNLIEKHQSELLLYIKYEENQEFYQTLEEKTGQSLHFMDREKQKTDVDR